MTEQGVVQVECYSGHTYAQEPRILVWEGKRHPVAAVEQRWRTPDGPAFRIRTVSGQRFELTYHEVPDHWRIQTLPNVDHKGTQQAKVLPLRPASVRHNASSREDKEVPN